MKKIIYLLALWCLTASSADAYYQAEQGRWINRDPIGERGGVNVYGCVSNNPAGLIDPFGLKVCKGKARVLKGNKNLIGKNGGFSGNKAIPVTPGSAAVDPAQWGGKGALRPNLDNISGVFTDDSGNQVGEFNGVSDVIGGESPIPGTNVRDALKQLNPGKLIVELPSAKKDLGTVNATITVPDGCPCPEGTK